MRWRWLRTACWISSPAAAPTGTPPTQAPTGPAAGTRTSIGAAARAAGPATLCCSRFFSRLSRDIVSSLGCVGESTDGASGFHGAPSPASGPVLHVLLSLSGRSRFSRHHGVTDSFQLPRTLSRDGTGAREPGCGRVVRGMAREESGHADGCAEGTGDLAPRPGPRTGAGTARARPPRRHRPALLLGRHARRRRHVHPRRGLRRPRLRPRLAGPRGPRVRPARRAYACVGSGGRAAHLGGVPARGGPVRARPRRRRARRGRAGTAAEAAGEAGPADRVGHRRVPGAVGARLAARRPERDATA